MAHRIIISSAIKALLQDPEVRQEMSAAKLARIDHVCTHTEISDDDFRFLTRCIDRAYCEED